MLFHFHNIIYQNSCVDLQRTKQSYSAFTLLNISVRQKKTCNESGKASQADVIVMKNPHISVISQKMMKTMFCI